MGPLGAGCGDRGGPEARLGSAYALMTFCLLLFGAGMSWGLGTVQDDVGWTAVVLWVAALAAVLVDLAFLLWREEGGPLAPGL